MEEDDDQGYERKQISSSTLLCLKAAKAMVKAFKPWQNENGRYGNFHEKMMCPCPGIVGTLLGSDDALRTVSQQPHPP